MHKAELPVYVPMRQRHDHRPRQLPVVQAHPHPAGQDRLAEAAAVIHLETMIK